MRSIHVQCVVHAKSLHRESPQRLLRNFAIMPNLDLLKNIAIMPNLDLPRLLWQEKMRPAESKGDRWPEQNSVISQEKSERAYRSAITIRLRSNSHIKTTINGGGAHGARVRRPPTHGVRDDDDGRVPTRFQVLPLRARLRRNPPRPRPASLQRQWAAAAE